MVKLTNKLSRRFLKASLWMIGSAASVCAVAAFATDGGGLGDMAERVTGSFQQIGGLLVAVAYLAGIGFSVAAIFKFKQHKDNPTQIPLGTPLAMLVIGIVLVFLPALFEPAGTTVVGKEGLTKVGGFTGKTGGIPGATK